MSSNPNVEISMDYEGMARAANAYARAANTYSKIIQQLRAISDELSKDAFQGFTGNAAENYVNHLVSQFSDLRRRATEMRKDIMDNVNKFRGEVDPGIASMFEAI